MKHCSNLVDSETGKTIGIYDENVSGGIYSFYAGPFEDYDEAAEFAEEYKERWYMGYNGRGQAVSLEEGYFARCSRWTSCD